MDHLLPRHEIKGCSGNGHARSQLFVFHGLIVRLGYMNIVTSARVAVRATLLSRRTSAPRMAVGTESLRATYGQTHSAALAMLPLRHGQENLYRRTYFHPSLPSFHPSATERPPANKVTSISDYPNICLFPACRTYGSKVHATSSHLLRVNRIEPRAIFHRKNPRERKSARQRRSRHNI